MGPGERRGQVGERQARVGGQLGQLPDGFLADLVGRDGQVEGLRRRSHPVALGRVEPPGQPAAAERAVGSAAHAVALRGGQHVALDDPGQDGVTRLLGPDSPRAARRSYSIT
jgi:hypothetical protein